MSFPHLMHESEIDTPVEPEYDIWSSPKMTKKIPLGHPLIFKHSYYICSTDWVRFLSLF